MDKYACDKTLTHKIKNKTKRKEHWLRENGTVKPPEEATSDRGIVSEWTAVSLGKGEITSVNTATNKGSRMTNWSA